MAIRSAALAGKKVTAGPLVYTHTNNVTDPKPMTGDQNLKNNQDPQDLLVDLDEGEPGVGKGDIYTHGGNDERGEPKPSQTNVKAATEGEDETPAQEQVPNDSINISTIPNDVNPLDGYPLKDNCSPGVLSESGKVEGEAMETELDTPGAPAGELAVEGAFGTEAPGATTNQSAGFPQNVAPLVAEESGTAADTDNGADQWEDDAAGSNPMANPPVDPAAGPAPVAPPVPAPVAPPPVAPAAPLAPAPIAAPAVPAPLPLPVPAPAPVAVPVAVQPPLPVPMGLGQDEAFEGDDDVMSILDTDGTDDGECGDLAFAQMGASVLVIKANRIIASIDHAAAVTAGCADEYTSDEFQEASLAECRRYGLRAGLESMGFALAEVNIGRSDVINARVEAKVLTATEDVRRTFADKDTSFGHCLAIAAVGVNQGHFKDVPNELRAALTNQLTAAGLRNADRVIGQVFAQYGTGYAKSIIAMAQKLSELEEPGRNSIAAALDLVSPEGKFEDPMSDEDDNEVSASFEGDELDAYEPPASVTAALSYAGQPKRDKGVLLTAKQSGYSVTAAAFLNSDELLF